MRPIPLALLLCNVCRIFISFLSLRNTYVSHMIIPTDILHLSPARQFKTRGSLSFRKELTATNFPPAITEISCIVLMPVRGQSSSSGTHNYGTNMQFGSCWLKERVLRRRISIHKGTVCVSCELLWIQNRTQQTEMFAVGDPLTFQPVSRRNLFTLLHVSVCAELLQTLQKKEVFLNQSGIKKI
jgi:hypothetical protein